MKPLARALVEQRRILALDAESKPLVLTALNTLSVAPERFTPESGVYLGLRSIYHDLEHAKSDDALREVVARLWDMALQLEDGNVSQAEQALRQAQEALRQALERGASDEEIKKLMEQLRAAMDKFLQALAEEMRKNRNSFPARSTATRVRSASRISRACWIGWRIWPAPATRTLRGGCSKNCNRCSKICRWRDRAPQVATMAMTI